MQATDLETYYSFGNVCLVDSDTAPVIFDQEVASFHWPLQTGKPQSQDLKIKHLGKIHRTAGLCGCYTVKTT